MIKQLLTGLTAGILVAGMLGSAQAITIIDNSTFGFYNDSIGTSLNLTNPFNSTYLFPGDYRTYGDPTFNPVPYEPDLIAADLTLGNWLSDPANLNTYWTFQSIPTTWPINTETAIVYRIDAGAYGMTDVQAQFGVDNGIFVWLDGTFMNGWLAPGGSYQWEYTQGLGSLSAGTHYLQILREDHGGSDSYTIHVTGNYQVPEPSAMLLLGTGLLCLVGLNRRRKA